MILAKARALARVEGPSERRTWTTTASAGEALRSVGLGAQPIQMSTAPSTTVPPGGLAVALRIPRAGSFVDGTRAPEGVTTTQGVRLGVDDVSVPSGDTPLTVQVVRSGVGELVAVRRIAPPEETVEDPELPRGRREVVEKGRPGEQTVMMRVNVQNGEEVRAGATPPPRKRVVRVGRNDDVSETVVALSAAAGIRDAPARCETGGTRATDTGNGYYGGLR